MNSLIDQIYSTGKTLAPDGTVYDIFPAAIKRPEGEAIYHLVRTLKPRATLEVGMAWGLSSLFICQALRDNAAPAHHTAIDPFQVHGFHSQALHNLSKAGLSDLLTFIEEPSQTALASLVKAQAHFDFMFIDGCHLFDGAFVDFYFADLLLPVGGHLVFDDLWMPAVRKVLAFILTNRNYQIAETLLPPLGDLPAAQAQDRAYQLKKKNEGKSDHGTPPESTFHLYRNINWTVLQKVSADQRPWDHFVAF